MFIYSDNRLFTIDVNRVEYDLLFWRAESIIFVFSHNTTTYSSNQRLLTCKHYLYPVIVTQSHSRINNMENEMLDLSGYTPEERRHLENVMMRQRHEEEKDRIIVE